MNSLFDTASVAIGFSSGIWLVVSYSVELTLCFIPLTNQLYTLKGAPVFTAPFGTDHSYYMLVGSFSCQLHV